MLKHKNNRKANPICEKTFVIEKHGQQKAHIHNIERKNSYRPLWETENSIVHWAKDLQRQSETYPQMENKQENITQHMNVM